MSRKSRYIPHGTIGHCKTGRWNVDQDSNSLWSLASSLHTSCSGTVGSRDVSCIKSTHTGNMRQHISSICSPFPYMEDSSRQREYTWTVWLVPFNSALVSDWLSIALWCNDSKPKRLGLNWCVSQVIRSASFFLMLWCVSRATHTWLLVEKSCSTTRSVETQC